MTRESGKGPVNIDPDFVNWLTLVEAEFHEMPGLHLTAVQMQRLWSLDTRTCRDIIDVLLLRGVLVETPGRTYALAARWHAGC